MSEAEFDSYLSLLSKFLRLRSRQRAELADELRDHLDSRLDELLAQGKSREQAIKIALEEFGDAAVLAEDFSRLASRRKRRFVMRCTAASAAVVAAVVLLSVALAPPGPNGPGPQTVVAQATADPLASGDDATRADAAASQLSVEQEAVAELDRRLSQVIPEIRFIETPLTEVLTFVADAVEADTLLDLQGLEEEGLTADVPVTLSLTRTKLSARTVLDFVLQPHDLTFVNRAGVIYVTTGARAEEHLTTKVYNVRDLLENATSHYEVPPSVLGGGFGGAAGGLGGGGGGGMGGGLGGEGTGGGGFFSVPDGMAAAVLMNSVGQFGGGGMPEPVPTGPAKDLIQAIQKSTSGNWMDADGQGGTLSLFNGLLVVRQTDEVHAQVQKLLDALREAGDGQPGKSVTVPKEGAEAATGNHTGRLRDLTLAAKYALNPGARACLLGALQTPSSGDLNTLDVLRGFTLTRYGQFDQDYFLNSIEPLGVSREDWIAALGAAKSQDEPFTSDDLATWLESAAKLTPNPRHEIDERHLFSALLLSEDRPISAALSHVGLNANHVVKKLGVVSVAPDSEAPAPPQAQSDETPPWRILGLKFEPAMGLEGLKITAVRPASPAADQWFIQPGDVLVGLGKWNVRTEEQLATALDNVKGWDAVQIVTVRGDE